MNAIEATFSQTPQEHKKIEANKYLEKFNVSFFTIPFAEELPDTTLGNVQLSINRQGKTLILRGMIPGEGELYIGDVPARLTVRYQSGLQDVYDLTVGEALWWGDRFGKYPEPFQSNAAARAVLYDCLQLLPQTTVNDHEGYYLAVALRNEPVERLTVEKLSSVPVHVYHAFVLEHLPKAFKDHLLEPNGVNAGTRQARIKRLRELLYVSDDNFPRATVYERPEGSEGQPVFRFFGDKYAQFYTNVLNFNLADMRRKIDSDGYCHTSTLGAPWYGYDTIGGTFTNEGRIYSWQEPGFYYRECWTRDVGRILIELMKFGCGDHVQAGLDWLLTMARRWEEPDAPTLDGHPLPAHIQRISQRYETSLGAGCFENDGHALCALAVCLYWKRSGDNAWLAEHKNDILALGNWYQWQFDHPEISRATDVLWSDSESSGWPFTTGMSFYVDQASCEALLGLAELAEALGEAETASRWRKLADHITRTCEKYYLGKWENGVCWCQNESWGMQTSLAHIILACDRGSMNVCEHHPEWNEYDRLGGLRNRQNYVHGAALGYMQAFTIQGALLKDALGDATEFLRYCAKMIYHPTSDRPYTVPESAKRVCEGTYTRMGDLGNGVQQAEILKSLRIIVGVDDMADVLTLIPRLPDGWDGAEVTALPVVTENGSFPIDYTYHREKNSAKISLSASQDLPACRVRLGAFAEDFTPVQVLLNGNENLPFTEEDAEGRKWLWVQLSAQQTAQGFTLTVQ